MTMVDESRNDAAGQAKRAGRRGRVAELEKRVAELEGELEKARDELLRAVAETQNLSRRLAEERERSRRLGREELAVSLGDVFDHVIAALSYAEEHSPNDAARKGFALLREQLVERLNASGISFIDPAGELFDHRYHHAVGVVETDEAEEGTIVEVVRKGIAFGDAVVRPCLVRVAKRPAAAPAERRDTHD